MRFLHSADRQLGKAFGRFEPDVRSALVETRCEAIEAIGQPSAPITQAICWFRGTCSTPRASRIVPSFKRYRAWVVIFAAGGCCRAIMITHATAGCGIG